MMRTRTATPPCCTCSPSALIPEKEQLKSKCHVLSSAGGWEEVGCFQFGGRIPEKSSQYVTLHRCTQQGEAKVNILTEPDFMTGLKTQFGLGYNRFFSDLI